MAESVNTQIADGLTEQQLRDARVEMGLRREVFAQLALLESEILSALKAMIRRTLPCWRVGVGKSNARWPRRLIR